MLIGVDIGGTKMLGLAASGGGLDVLAECRVPTPTAGDELVESVLALVATLEQECAVPATAFAVGIAGLIDRGGVVRYSPHLADVVEYPLAERLRAALQRPVVVENDLTMATLGEARLGAGRKCPDLIMVGLGTGIGTKFLIEG